jgi:hypothetical protein
MASRRQTRAVAFGRTTPRSCRCEPARDVPSTTPRKAEIRSTLKSHYPWRRDSLILFAVYGYSSRQDNLM